MHASLPVPPPVAPMLARLARELPSGDHLYEPKWDGFRCLVFRDGHEVDLRSRNDRPLARYFPEIVEAVRCLPAPRVVLDGELVVVAAGRFRFEELLSRLHPAASRVERLAQDIPASLVAFDVLALDDDDLRERPFAERRKALERLLAEPPPRVHLSPATSDRDQAARWLASAAGGGVDGVMVKPRNLSYQPGKRAMVKVKPEWTADCVVGGFRLAAEDQVASLLLGLYDEHDALQLVGVASSFTTERRRALLEEVAPYAGGLQGHPWERGYGLQGGPMGRLGGAAGRWEPGMPRDWVPLRPELVCEVAYEHLEGHRFRHPARFRRWRPDRDPRSCRFDQLRPMDAVSGLVPA